MNQRTYYVSIGNSDDKLSQRQWCEFVQAVEEVLEKCFQFHGIWFSRPDAAWQNACWCCQSPGEGWNTRSYYDARRKLRELAAEFNQDSITWAEAYTDFLTPQHDYRPASDLDGSPCAVCRALPNEHDEHWRASL